MAAYVVGIIDVTDPYAYELYEELTPPAVAKYGGRHIIQGDHLAVFEGSPAQDGSCYWLLEFENFEKAKEWWTSPGEAESHRHGSVTSTIVLVEGVA